MRLELLLPEVGPCMAFFFLLFSFFFFSWRVGDPQLTAVSLLAAWCFWEWCLLSHLPVCDKASCSDDTAWIT